MRKHKSAATLAEDAAKLLQRLVRVKAAVAAGDELIRCVSCGKYGSWRDMDGGHYISRRRAATKLMEENVHPQCKSCNGYQNGNLIGYTLHMIDTYGPEMIRELHDLSRRPHKWARLDLLERIIDLRSQLAELEAQL